MKTKESRRGKYPWKFFALEPIGLFLVLVLFSSGLFAQMSRLPVFITDSLDNFIVKGMADWEIPGLSIAIVKDGEVLLLKGYGVTKAGGTEPVDENTLFLIGSLTKAFTSSALAILEQEGNFRLEDKVQKWMPHFALGDDFATKETTILDLLSLRTGLSHYQGEFVFANSRLSRAEIIDHLKWIETPSPLRTKYGYNNLNYLVAGELIQEITGKSWEETVKEKILLPLEMHQTLMLTAGFCNAPGKATGHSLVNFSQSEVPVLNYDNLAPAGSMSSCAKDMASWLLAHLNRGKRNGQQLLPERALMALRTPQTIIGMDNRVNQPSHFSLYGLGLRIIDRNGVVVYQHSGNMPGFVSQLAFIPEKNLGLVIMSNNDYNSFTIQLSNEIVDAFLDIPCAGYNPRPHQFFSQYVKNQVAKLDSLQNLVNQHLSPGVPLENFAGIYKNELYGQVEIRPEGQALRIFFPLHPGLTAKLEHLQNNVFLCTFANPFYEGIFECPFYVEEEKVSGFTLPVPPQIEYATYKFLKKMD